MEELASTVIQQRHRLLPRHFKHQEAIMLEYCRKLLAVEVVSHKEEEDRPLKAAIWAHPPPNLEVLQVITTLLATTINRVHRAAVEAVLYKE